MESFEQAEEDFRKLYSLASDAADYFDLLERIAPAHRASKGLHSTLQAAREQVSNDQQIITLRDRAYEVERELELLYRDAENALNFHIARQAEAQANSGEQAARSGQRLNMLAAIFFPITAIASVFSTTLSTGLERQNPMLFWGSWRSALFLVSCFTHGFREAPGKSPEQRNSGQNARKSLFRPLENVRIMGGLLGV